MKTSIIIAIFWFLTLPVAVAQTTPDTDWKKDRSVSVLFGMSQLLLTNGFNIEGNVIYNRFIFDYSHGASLEFNKNVVSTELKNQGVVVHMPWTTGFGVGYRIRNWVNLRVEPKWHRFEYFYDGDDQRKSNQITANNTFSLGLGLYMNYRPFKKQNNALKGLTLAPSIRYWPTVSSTFSDNKHEYINRNTDKTEVINTQDPGINFTPLIVNLSIGYTLDLRKRH